MFRATTQIEDKSRNVKRAVDKGAFTNLGHAAASIRKSAAKSIKQRKDKDKSSPVGTAPFTHGGFIRRALRFDVNKQKQEALIGFRFSVIGLVGRTHEFGEVEDGRDYPERPTLAPALEASIGRIAGQWQGSIGS